MKWHKKGLIFAPSGDMWWARSYALVPTVDILNEEVVRVYFASLDENKYGRIGYIDLDSTDLGRILGVSKEPVLDLGDIGAFDDSGVNPSCVLNIAGKKHLYYIGWQRCERIPYMLFAGLAISTNGDQFRKQSVTPILERTSAEPFLRSATSVIFDNGIFRMWYVAGIDWTTIRSTSYPTYVIRYAESVDGIIWREQGHNCIGFADKDEFGLGRPWVLKDDNILRMWYSIRSRSAAYRIGYAESTDGLHWTRKDNEAGIVASPTGWDSEMVCYPCVADINGERYMFYNGNQHGSTGFGYALLERGA